MRGSWPVQSAEAARAVRVSHPRGVARWGDEIDVQVLEHCEDRARRLATYVARYTTKSSSDYPSLERHIRSGADLERRALPPHLYRMVAPAWTLGQKTPTSCRNEF
jgi:hypothetical protein